MTGLEVIILGCGSSGGVPRGNGDWGACDRAEPRNRRTRCSLALRRHGPEGVTTLVIDTSPDLRAQMLASDIRTIDGVALTHDHADQTHGLDDLRVFAYAARRRVPVWMDAATDATLDRRFGYAFKGELGYPPICDAHVIAAGDAFSVEGPGGPMPVETFNQAHGPIGSIGYRLGGVAYSSDVSHLGDDAFEAIRGVDLWIVDALRWTQHPTHAHVDEALSWIARSGVRRAVLTNLHIDLDYNRLSAMLPAHVSVAHDGWATVLEG